MHQELVRSRRPPDGLLHPSSHLTGSLRHAQLDVAGAPKKAEAFISEIVLMTGTLWHEWIHNALRRVGVPYMAEVNLTPWLPEGWGGTADAVIWNPDLKAFVLVDFKTTKGEGMRYIARDGAKEEHRWQTSLYWHGLKKMGLPLAKAIGVLYIPKNDTRTKDELIEPVMIDFEPIPAKELNAETGRRSTRVEEYVETIEGTEKYSVHDWLTDALEPVHPRKQTLHYDRATGTHEVKLTPPWYAAYCPFPEELCSCSTEGTTKIGTYDVDGTYIARSGFEHLEPLVAP